MSSLASLINETDPATMALGVVDKHPGILMMPLLIFSILFILIGIIVTAASSNKTTGIVLTVFGFLVGGASFAYMIVTERNESRKN